MEDRGRDVYKGILCFLSARRIVLPVRYHPGGGDEDLER